MSAASVSMTGWCGVVVLGSRPSEEADTEKQTPSVSPGRARDPSWAKAALFGMTLGRRGQGITQIALTFSLQLSC